MANTLILISSVTVGAGGSASIDFTSIPSTYTDLKLVYSLRNNRTDGNSGYGYITLNSSTASFTVRGFYDTGNGGIATDITTSNYFAYGINTDLLTASIFSNGELYICNYAGSTNKPWYSDNAGESAEATNPFREIHAGVWANSAAITSISLTTQSTKVFKQYSTAYLYGIKNS